MPSPSVEPEEPIDSGVHTPAEEDSPAPGPPPRACMPQRMDVRQGGLHETLPIGLTQKQMEKEKSEKKEGGGGGSPEEENETFELPSMGISTKGEAGGNLVTLESSKNEARMRTKTKKKRKVVMGVKTMGLVKKRRASLDSSSRFNPDPDSQKKSDTEAVSSSTKQKEPSARVRGIRGDHFSRLQPLKVSIKTQESNYTEEAGKLKLSGVQSLPSLGRGSETQNLLDKYGKRNSGVQITEEKIQEEAGERNEPDRPRPELYDQWVINRYSIGKRLQATRKVRILSESEAEFLERYSKECIDLLNNLKPNLGRSPFLTNTHHRKAVHLKSAKQIRQAIPPLARRLVCSQRLIHHQKQVEMSDRKEPKQNTEMVASGFKVDTLLKSIQRTRQNIGATEGAQHQSRFVPPSRSMSPPPVNEYELDRQELEQKEPKTENLPTLEDNLKATREQIYMMYNFEKIDASGVSGLPPPTSLLDFDSDRMRQNQESEPLPEIQRSAHSFEPSHAAPPSIATSNIAHAKELRQMDLPEQLGLYTENSISIGEATGMKNYEVSAMRQVIEDSKRECDPRKNELYLQYLEFKRGKQKKF